MLLYLNKISGKSTMHRVQKKFKKLHTTVWIVLSIFSPVQREMENASLTYSLSENLSIMSRSQENCKKAKETEK